MRQLAQSAGASDPYLSQIERGLRKPSADILQQLAKGLRISCGKRSHALAGPHLSSKTGLLTGASGPLLADQPEALGAAEAGAHRDLRVVPPGERDRGSGKPSRRN